MPYLSYIPDHRLEEIVKTILEKGKKSIDNSEKNPDRNVIDPFSAIFESAIYKMNYEQWIIKEQHRQSQKTISNAIGNFHQEIITSIPNWEDTKNQILIDAVNNDEKIIAEIKNKYNTIKASDLQNTYKTLEKLISQKGQVYRGYKAYLVQIIPSNLKKYNAPFTPSDNSTGGRCPSNEDIRVIDGFSFYEIATGKKNALEELYEALPKVLQELGIEFKMTKDFEDIFSRAFK